MYRIYVSTFGKEIKKIDGAIPIEVGAADRENFVYDLRDNTGINISHENPYYGELTGLYWIRHNEEIKDDDIVGFCHYNKSLMIKKEKVIKLLKNGADFVVCRHQIIPKMNNHKDYLVFMDILKQYSEDVYNAFYNIYGEDGASNKCNAKNTFITTGKEFRQYCDFLFPLLEICRHQIGDVPERKIKRYNALFTERLFTAYLIGKKKKFYEADISYSDWKLTVSKMIINRVPFPKDNAVLAFFRIKVRKSSYFEG